VSEPAADRPSILEYVQIPLRRPWHVVIPFVVVTLLAVGFSLTITKTYTSSTLILVESDKVPQSFINEGTRDAAASRPRLQTIRQEILSRTRLERILEELNPYPERTGRAPLTAIVEDMRQAIAINVKGNDSFSLEYTHRDPKIAQAVTARLATLFIEESSQARKTQVEVTGEFIESQLVEARQKLEEKEKALRQYKESRMGRLPEQTGANLAILQRLQLEQQSVSDSLRAARERVLLVERGMSSTAGANAANDPAAELAAARNELASLRARYTDEHPDVKALQSRVARLEKQVASRSTTQSDQGDAQLEQAKAEVRHLEGKLADVDRRIAMFQGRVEETPRTEQELATLTRDYQQLNQNYLDLLRKKMDAQMAERLQDQWKTDNFRILDPAFLPERAVSPNRWMFLWLGMAAGLLAGLAASVVAEMMDPTIKNLREVEAILPFPVLAALPHLDAAAAAGAGKVAHMKTHPASRARGSGSRE
jgi:polysaccharide chain length determinant protein (PEP-CTERM system associated)